MSAAPDLSALVPLAVSLLLKVTIVFAAAGSLAAALHRRSAATRHFVWQCALAGSLALLGLLPLAPRIRVPLPEPIARLVPAQRATPSEARIAPIDAPVVLNEGDALANPLPARNSPARPLDLVTVLALCWLAGSVTLLGVQLAAHAGLRRIESHAEPVADEALLAEVAALRHQLGVRAAVRVRTSERVGGPLTWGWRNAIVLLPAHWRTWSAERRRSVLLHELAHVARSDYAVQRIASLACALYWFHPLAWSAAARLRSESEMACDDCVLGAGTPAPDYAQELLSVARDMRAQRRVGSMAIGMARPTQIEGRLLAMLDDCRSRSTLSARSAGLTLVLLLASLVPLAGLTVHPVAATTTTTRLRHDTMQDRPTDPDAHVERTFRAHGGGRLTLDLPAGADVEVQGWDRDEVGISAQLAGKDWRRTVLEFDPESDGVTVHLRPEAEVSMYSSSHALSIHVPRRYDVHLESAGGDLSLHDLSGRFEGHTGGGTLELSHLRGHADLHTGGGQIQVSDCTLSGSVQTGGGGIRLERVEGGLNGWSGSQGHVGPSEDSGDGSSDEDPGSVTNEVDDSGLHDHAMKHSAGNVHESKDGGEIVLDDAPHGASLATGGGAIRVGTAGGDVTARTGGGDIVLGPVAGSVQATTGAGLVHVTLTDAGGRRQDVDVWSGTGQVILELPRSLDARFDLESAYTRGHARTQIQSDFDLDHSETTDWDPTRGTPRRYVRARGVSGSGRGHVQVRTVNGDIEVRQTNR